MDWQFKSATFRLLSAAPLGTQLHFAAQRYVTRTLPRHPKSLDALWLKAQALLSDYRANTSRKVEDSVFLELGAGRDLAVPIAIRLLGGAKVIPTDVERLAKLDLVRHAARHYFAKVSLPMPDWRSWSDVERFGVHYRAPATVAEVGDRIDCVCSNEVLEHIPTASLHEIARDSRRLITRDGLCIHSIDYGDHYARSDTSIDRFNFLRFDDAQWSRHNSRMQYVNRLRPIDYENIFLQAGWSIRSVSVRPGERKATTRDNVSEQFKSYSDRDLFALNGRLVMSPSPAVE